MSGRRRALRRRGIQWFENLRGLRFPGDERNIGTSIARHGVWGRSGSSAPPPHEGSAFGTGQTENRDSNRNDADPWTNRMTGTETIDRHTRAKREIVEYGEGFAMFESQYDLEEEGLCFRSRYGCKTMDRGCSATSTASATVTRDSTERSGSTDREVAARGDDLQSNLMTGGKGQDEEPVETTRQLQRCYTDFEKPSSSHDGRDRLSPHSGLKFSVKDCPFENRQMSHSSTSRNDHRQNQGRRSTSSYLTRSSSAEQLESGDDAGSLAEERYRSGMSFVSSGRAVSPPVLRAGPPEYYREETHRRRESTPPNRERHSTTQHLGSHAQRPFNPAVAMRSRRPGESSRQESHAPPKSRYDDRGSRRTYTTGVEQHSGNCRKGRGKRRISWPTDHQIQNKRRHIEPRSRKSPEPESQARYNGRNVDIQSKKVPRPRQRCRISLKDEFTDYLNKSGSKSSDETASYLANHLEQLRDYFKHSSFQQIMNILKLTEQIGGSTCCQSVQTIMLYISKEQLFSSAELEKELMILRVGDADVTEEKRHFLQTLLRAMDHVLKIKMNVGCLDVDYGILRCSDIVRNIPCLRNSIATSPAVVEDLNKVEESMEQFQKMREERKSLETDGATETRNQELSMGPGPSDITQTTILPIASELTPSRTICPLVKMQSRRSFDNETHYLRSLFNLYREDFVRQLISSICLYCKTCEEGEEPPTSIRGLKMYTGVTAKDSKCANLDGVVYTVQFDNRPFKSMRWSSSKRLKYGSLVCLSSDNFSRVIFATVANRKPEDLKYGQLDLLFLSGQHMESHDEQTFVMIESDAFYPAYSFTLEGLVAIAQRIGELGLSMPLSRYYVEGATDPRPPAYLIPQTEIEPITFDFTCLIGSPDARREKSQGPTYKSVAVLDESAWPDAKRLKLNASQYDALKAMVMQELPLIQGPPGTGKTFLGWKCLELLLNNRHAWTQNHYSAPILVVCYTNRALDQFLERVLKFPCIQYRPHTALVRVGSRCLVESLAKHNLATVRRNVENIASCEANYKLKDRGRLHDHTQSKVNRYYSGILHEDFLRKKGVISRQQYFSLVQMPNIQGNMPVILTWLDIRIPPQGDIPHTNRAMEQEVFDDDFVLEEEYDIHREDIWDDMIDETYVFRASEDENMFALNFESIGADLDTGNADWEGSAEKEQMAMWKRRLESAVSSPDALPEEEGRTPCHLWPIEVEQRWRLYRTWLRILSMPKLKRLTEIKEEYNRDSKLYKEARRVGDQTILRSAELIGMTTTGAARNLDAIRAVGPKVVIVEEAAEVPESHVVTALGPCCQHLILIGDHQQLRPSYNDYTLAKENGIDLSLFERLTRNGQNATQLRVQHRMRPEISRLLVPHIYKELRDHESTMTQENVRGITTNVFFIDHRELERQDSHSTSHENPHEAKFLLSLASYCLRQGYQAHQITILTTYSGQYFLLSRLKSEMHELDKGIKVATVDNYQGEENDIILLSLVRSNRADRIGHLAASNRVCVSLSRARIGLYVIGNVSLLERNSEVWKQVVATARSFGQVGTSLKLQCQRHGNITKVSSHRNFESVRDGGCAQACQTRLKCGHTCHKSCHVDDPEHETPCHKPCKKPLCSNPDHLCERECYQCIAGCGKCTFEVVKIVNKCGHSQKVECHVEPDDILCTEKCVKKIDCGHTCQRLCRRICNSSENCMTLVKEILRCGHKNQVPCSCRDTFKCRVPCEERLSCGHLCKGTCGMCKHGRLHQPCRFKCERILLCDHVCGKSCTSYCPPCSHACEMRCEHSRCERQCCFPCIPCRENCPWECDRSCPNRFRCGKSCYQDCDRPRCEKRCRKLCPGCKCKKSRCIGVCGELCPNVCRKCEPLKLTEHMLSGTEKNADAKFIQLQGCEHLVELTFMDKWMETNVEDGDQSVGLKGCPVCRRPITSGRRYGNLIRQRVADMEKVKNKIKDQDFLIKKTKLRERVSELEIVDPSAYEVLKSRLERRIAVTQLNNLLNQTNFIISLANLRATVRSDLEAYCPDLAKKLLVELNDLKEWTLLKRYYFSEQEIIQFKAEHERVAQAIAFQQLLRDMSIKNKALVHLESSIHEAVRSLENPETLTETSLRTTREVLNEARAELPGLAVTDNERLQILKALDFHKKGRWYKCKNGHYYVIGECGGAVEEAKCSECSETVGGENHRIREDNETAPEMEAEPVKSPPNW